MEDTFRLLLVVVKIIIAYENHLFLSFEIILLFLRLA